MLKQYEVVECTLRECHDRDSNILVFINPDEGEKKMLIERYNIDEHTLHSALDPNELARIETEPDHIAIILKVPKGYAPGDDFEFSISSMGIFSFEKQLIFILPEENDIISGKPFANTPRLSEIILRAVNLSIHHFREHLVVIDRVSEELADRISTSMDNKYLLRLFALEKSLVYYLNGISSNGVLMEKSKSYAEKMNFTQEDVELLDDMIIDNSQCFKQAETLSNIFSSMMDARVSIVNNNLNILMKRLNIITIGLMVPTLVVSIFSMNVVMPLQKHSHAFWIIMAIAFISMAGVFLFWRFKK